MFFIFMKLLFRVSTVEGTGVFGNIPTLQDLGALNLAQQMQVESLYAPSLP